ncbi:molybdopterin molybdotransferase MoeA [Opitutus terrae]|uniref:Molybdopterin molybdenumtransferase n=1 Tax=Opitutus terrae (strain DSM 11246 / JCM 15787 / PB90-1) TaxID=452637 RepID=B1ZXL6_OPITP|nr:molybdopterin molybdotransferase MoeA [Opitutus terrae]ACB74238.1 molybdenum cofactor synthesis domain protein [Opitutus terrae PB90-1]
MITPAEAEATIQRHVSPFPTEICPLLHAHGRVLRSELRADRDLPPFDRVTMDGFALRAAAVAKGVQTFRIEALQPAGVPAATLSTAADACVEVMTGAMLPSGADAVVPYEDTAREGATMRLLDRATVTPGAAVHRRGSDHRAGDRVVRAGLRLSGREIAIAASIGAGALSVAAQPRIALIASGDELVEPDVAVAPHQIRRSNDYGLRAALITAGYPRVENFHLRDVRHEIDALIERVLRENDVIVMTGGVSKGRFDLVPAALEAQGVRKIFHGVAQRPGKPFWFGGTTGGQLVFALPGNPISAYTCLHRYVLPALDLASGLDASPNVGAALSERITCPTPLTFFLPVKLATGPRAELLATPRWPNTSGDLAGLSDTDGFVELPPEQREFPAGTVLRVFRW